MGRWTTRVVVLVGVVLAFGFVALGGVGGYLVWTRAQLNAQEATRVALGPCEGGMVRPRVALPPNRFRWSSVTTSRPWSAASPMRTTC